MDPLVPVSVTFVGPPGTATATGGGTIDVGGRQFGRFARGDCLQVFDRRERSYLVPWKGEAELYFRFAGPRLYQATRPGGPWTLVGVDARGPVGQAALDDAIQEGASVACVFSPHRTPDDFRRIECARPAALFAPKPRWFIEDQVLPPVPILACEWIDEGASDEGALARLGEARWLAVDCASLEMLRGMKGIEALELSGVRPAHVESLRSWGVLDRVGVLSLRGEPELADLVHLSGLPSLVALDIGSCPGLWDLSALRTLPQLSALVLGPGSPQRRIETASGLPRLAALDFKGDAEVKALEFLRGAGELAWLRVRECHALEDLSALQGLGRLSEVDLSACGVGSIEPLRTATCLRVLSLAGCNHLADLGPLRGLPLSALRLEGCVQVVDLEPLHDVHGLVFLSVPPRLDTVRLQGLRDHGVLDDLRGLELQVDDPIVTSEKPLTGIEPLAGLPWLASLDIGPCHRLASLGPLRNLPGLRRLRPPSRLRDLNLEELRAVGVLDRLVELDLRKCASLTRLDPLAGLQRIEHLDLKDCPSIASLAPLADLASLQFIDLRGCKGIQSLTPLRGCGRLEAVFLPRYGKFPKSEAQELQGALPRCEVRSG